MKAKATQACLTLCNPMDYTGHGILQARTLEWAAFPFSGGSSQPRGRTQVSRTAGRFFTSWATREAQAYGSGKPVPSPADLPDPGVEPGSPALQADSLPTEPSGKAHMLPPCWCCFCSNKKKNPPHLTFLLHLLITGSILESCQSWPNSKTVTPIFNLYSSPERVQLSSFHYI